MLRAIVKFMTTGKSARYAKEQVKYPTIDPRGLYDV